MWCVWLSAAIILDAALSKCPRALKPWLNVRNIVVNPFEIYFADLLAQLRHRSLCPLVLSANRCANIYSSVWEAMYAMDSESAPVALLCHYIKVPVLCVTYAC